MWENIWWNYHKYTARQWYFDWHGSVSKGMGYSANCWNVCAPSKSHLWSLSCWESRSPQWGGGPTGIRSPASNFCWFWLGVNILWATHHRHDDVGKDEDKGEDGKDDPGPELGQLGCVLLLHLNQVLCVHQLGWVSDEMAGCGVKHLDDEELKEAEAAVVGDRVEPGVGHCDVGHLMRGNLWGKDFEGILPWASLLWSHWSWCWRRARWPVSSQSSAPGDNISLLSFIWETQPWRWVPGRGSNRQWLLAGLKECTWDPTIQMLRYLRWSHKWEKIEKLNYRLMMK